MKALDPELVFNPYEWLPGYGESDVSFQSDGLDLIVTIKYDKESDDGASVLDFKRNLIFLGTRLFIREPFPGNFVFEGMQIIEAGRLVVFNKSDLLVRYESMQKKLYGIDSLKLRHFYIQFLSENMTMHALARDFCLSEEMLC